MINELGIPEHILKDFLAFANKPTKTTKNYYTIDKDTGDKVLNKVVEEDRPRDLKQVISFYEKMYPQYFDPLTREKLLALQQATGTNDADAFKADVLDMFSVKGQ